MAYEVTPPAKPASDRTVAPWLRGFLRPTGRRSYFDPPEYEFGVLNVATGDVVVRDSRCGRWEQCCEDVAEMVFIARGAWMYSLGDERLNMRGVGRDAVPGVCDHGCGRESRGRR